MHPVLRVLSVMFGALLVTVNGRAQPEARPAIFAPQREPAAPAAPHTPYPAASERVRFLISEAANHFLENVTLVDAPSTTAGTTVDQSTGATVMAPVVVRGLALKESQLRPPPVRLYHFTPLGGDKYRRIAGGATAPLFHTFIGHKEFQADLNVLNCAGRGIDHNIDFTRVEIAFSLKW